MGYPRRLDHLRAFQFDRTRAQVVEQPDSVPEQDGHQVYVYLVEESGPNALLRDAGGAHGDILLACYRFRSLYGVFDAAIRDERERRSLVNPSPWESMGDDEGGYAQGGSATPPVGDVERPPSRHERSHLAVRLLKELSALRRDPEHHLGTRQPVFGVAARIPVEEPHPTLAQWVLWSIVRPGDEPIQRHRKPRSYFAHVYSPFDILLVTGRYLLHTPAVAVRVAE